MGHCCYRHGSEEKYPQYHFCETIVLSDTYINSISPSIHSTIVSETCLRLKAAFFSQCVYETRNICKMNTDFPTQLVKGNKLVFCKEECISVFCINLRMNSDYFPIQPYKNWFSDSSLFTTLYEMNL